MGRLADSVHPADCPSWDYEDHPRHKDFLKGRISVLLQNLRLRKLDYRYPAADTRPLHRLMFQSMTPHGHAYFAGHYRGESFRCLRNYQVGIQGDPSVGVPADTVYSNMSKFLRQTQDVLAALDESFRLPSAHLSEAKKITYLVAAACQIFVEFLRIHPYANGNGHIGRLILFTLFARYQVWPRSWTVEPRPPDPPYTAAIEAYRRGNPQILEAFVMRCLIGN